MDDSISRQAAIDAMANLQGVASTKAELKGISKAWKRIKQLPSVQSEKATCYGYDVNELIAFARVCRENGISDTDLKEFVRNYANAWELAFRNYEEHFRGCLEKVMEGIGGDAND